MLTSIYKSSPQIIKRMLYDKVSYYSVNSEVTTATSYRSKYKAYDLVFLDNLRQTASIANKKQLFKFIHLMGVHPPMFYYFNGTDFIETDERQTFTESAKASVEILRQTLDKYKELGIYDNASIFIIADHGIGAMSWPYPTIEEIIKNMPLALYKPPHSRGKMTVSDRPYYAIDLKDTILYEAGLSTEKGLYSAFPKYDIRAYLLYSGSERNNWLSFYLSDIQEYIIKGNVNDPKNWTKTGNVYRGGSVSSYGFNYNLGKTIHIIEPKEDDVLGGFLYASALSIRYEDIVSGNTEISLTFNEKIREDLVLEMYITPVKYKNNNQRNIKIRFNDKEIANLEIENTGIVKVEIPAKLIQKVNKFLFELPSKTEKSFILHALNIHSINQNVSFESDVNLKFPPYFLLKGEKLLLGKKLLPNTSSLEYKDLEDALCFGGRNVLDHTVLGIGANRLCCDSMSKKRLIY
jgi:hypothetical protein